MPTFRTECDVEADRSTVWKFVKDINNWADMFPGYQRHLELGADFYRWEIRGETGAWSRLVEFDVQVMEWNEPESVVFALEGRTEPITGTGSFRTSSADSSDHCRVVFELDARASGAAAPMINALLERFLRERADDFLADLGSRITTLRPGVPALRDALQVVPTGPGYIDLACTGPRNGDTERWLLERLEPALRRWPYVRRVDRFQVASTSKLATFRYWLRTSDVRASFRHPFPAELVAEAGMRDIQVEAPMAFHRLSRWRSRPWSARVDAARSRWLRKSP